MKYLLSFVKLLLINNFSNLLSAKLNSTFEIKVNLNILFNIKDALFFVSSGEESIFNLVGALREAAKIAASYIRSSLGDFLK